jgi:hypothetical protein
MFFRNVNVLKELGTVKMVREGAEDGKQKCCRTQHYTAAIHQNMIVWQYRKLCKTKRNHSDNMLTTGMG